MDSFLVVLLVEHLEARYQIRLPDDSVAPEKLATINGVARLVVQLGNEEGPGFDG